LVGNLAIGRLVADRRQLRANAASVSRRLTTLRRVRRAGGIDLAGLGSLGSSSLTLFSSFTLRLFLLLAGLPFLADLLEFCKRKIKSVCSTTTRQRAKDKIQWC
jgi:hypothetical protein